MKKEFLILLINQIEIFKKCIFQLISHSNFSLSSPEVLSIGTMLDSLIEIYYSL